jgi:T5SS/PEP-CTERM-associated repeat protein
VKDHAVIILAVLLIAATTAYSETATTNIIQGQYINHGGQFVLGEAGPSNFLLIRNEGWLENTAGIIGYEPGADANVAWVTGANSLWDNRGALRIGVLGRDNRLVITNAGRVNVFPGVLGDEETSSGNSVLVTGSGSRWSSHALQVGFRGYSNQFTIAQGALATSGGAFDAVGYNEPSYGNRMRVEGPGSSFHGYNLAVGSFGSHANELRIVNGGQVATTSGFIGNGASNTVWISDPGSVWYNAAVFFHGFDGLDNRLAITNGGRVFSEGALISGANNLVTISGTNSLWETGGENGQFDMGNPGVSNHVSIMNGGRLNSRNGYVVGDFSRMHLTDPGSLWQNARTITVGEEFGVGNELTIANRARLNTKDLTLAADFGTLNVQGAATILEIAGLLSIGDEFGRGNQFTISSGGQVTNTDGYLGGTASAFLFGENTRNRALITGAGSAWINRSNVTVGVTGSETELAVRNGGRVSNRTSFLGYYGYSRNNRVIVSDANSLWDNAGDLYVGYASSGNALVITNQGRVQSAVGWVGRNFNETNSVLVSGPNSLWAIGGPLLVGNSGSGNRVTISDGGRLASVSGVIDSPNGRSNSVVVTGPASTWIVDNTVTVGGISSLNHLRIDNGASVFAGGLSVGNTGTSVSNTLTVANARLVVTNANRTATLTVNEGAVFLVDADLVVDRLHTTAATQSIISFLSGNANVRTLSLSGSGISRIGAGEDMARMQLGASPHTIGTLIVEANSILAVAGTISGVVTNGGLLEIGTNVAGVSVVGRIIQTPGSSMAFDLGGVIQGTGYDLIQLDGVVHFDGTLRLRLANGFVPTSNSVFTLISARANSGSFVNAPNGGRVTIEGTGVSCQVDYSAGLLRLLNFQNAGPAGTNEIDEAWAIRYFGHSPLTDAEKQADPDADGLNNLQEYIAGTNPLDASSALRILSVSRNELGQPIIDFSAATNKLYGVAFSSDLENWSEAPSPTFNPLMPGVLQWADTALQAGQTRFYRVRIRE